VSQLKDGLRAARGSIVFLVGLTLAFATVFGLERWKPQSVGAMKVDNQIEFVNASEIPLREHRELNTTERAMAEVAWTYFKNNTNENTGLVNSVDGYTAATLWDTASYLLGLISAHDLDLIESDEFDGRLRQVLGSLAALPLFEDRLPNKVYSTTSGAMTTYENRESNRGVGWSAIDIGRIMVPFNVLVWQHPQYTDLVDNVLNNWDMHAILRDAEMIGADISEEGETLYLQEGRLGYEEYASKSLVLAGLDLSEAVNYERYFEYVDIDGIDVGTDLRTPDLFDAINFVVSEPYVLDGIEYGWDRYSRSLAYRVYEAQHARFKRTGTLTAVSEDNIDQAPYFVYNTVFADGKAWNAVTEKGEEVSELRTLSSKAALGWYALYDTDYTEQLFERIHDNFDKEKGWYAGIYEKTGEINKALTANTNAIVLESLRYIQHGPMVRIGRAASL